MCVPLQVFINQIESAIFTLRIFDVPFNVQVPQELQIALAVDLPEEVNLSVLPVVHQMSKKTDEVHCGYGRRIKVFQMLKKPPLLVAVSKEKPTSIVTAQ